MIKRTLSQGSHWFHQVKVTKVGSIGNFSYNIYQSLEVKGGTLCWETLRLGIERGNLKLADNKDWLEVCRKT